jgi:hypothetical protein
VRLGSAKEREVGQEGGWDAGRREGDLRARRPGPTQHEDADEKSEGEVSGEILQGDEGEENVR